MPSGKDIVEGENLTVQSLLETLVSKYGSRMARELMSQGRLREGLVLLINGRNVLSLPEKYETLLKEGDELLVTIMVAGG
jgi:molybdopterin converting factor small subunit